jgi:hypothetical protein
MLSPLRRFLFEIKHFLQGRRFTDFRKEPTLQRTRLLHTKILSAENKKSRVIISYTPPYHDIILV